MMQSPCMMCYIRGAEYTPECDSRCEHAYIVSKLRPYGGIDEVMKILSSIKPENKEVITNEHNTVEHRDL